MNTEDNNTGFMQEKSLNLFSSLSLLQYWYYCILNSLSSVRFKMGQVTWTLTSVLRRLFYHQASVTVFLIMLPTTLGLVELDKNAKILLKVKRRLEIRGERAGMVKVFR